MAELPDATYERIVLLSDEGDSLAEQGHYAAAVANYTQAWELLPEPRTQWEAATWLLTAIGDAHFLSGSFEAGCAALLLAMQCPDAIGNPFIHLRLGQCQFEIGSERFAADELTRAYMAEGKDIFGGEDPKYFEFLKTVLEPPAGGWE